MDAIEARVLAFDAAPLIARGLASGALLPYRRFQAYVNIPDLFEQPDPRRCTCGCGQRLQGRQTRWASKACAGFGLEVLYIIKGTAATIRHYLELSRGACCACCWVIGEPLQVDHIVPVSHGGSGRWLDNYQLLCHDCHTEKTQADKLLKQAA